MKNLLVFILERKGNYQYVKKPKKGYPDIYKDGKCLFPFKVKRNRKTEEFQNCSYKSADKGYLKNQMVHLQTCVQLKGIRKIMLQKPKG